MVRWPLDTEVNALLVTSVRMEPGSVTRWQSDVTLRDEQTPETYPKELVSLPWIDIHNHAQTLSWSDREQFALTGCEVMVMMAYGYHWAPYKPVRPAHVQYQWDDALSRLFPILQTHPFDAKLGIGVHTGVRVEDYTELIEIMPEYCELDEVCAVGETGITPQQQGARWELEAQKAIVRDQMQIASEFEYPVILHSPSPSSDHGVSVASWYEKDFELSTDPVMQNDAPVMASIELDLELCHASGLAESRLVFSHANPEFAPFVLENTDCFVSYTLNYPRMHGNGLTDIVAMIEEYGSDRILLETDSAGVLRSDPSVVKRSIFELYRAGISLDEIRRVVYENQQSLLSID